MSDTVAAPPGAIGLLVEGYIRLRDKKAEIKARHEAEMAPVNAMMDKIEIHLLAKMQEQGVESYKTGVGTAYTTTRSSVTCADGAGFIAWAIETGNTHMIERRAVKTAVDEFVAQHKDLPPGLTYRTETVVNVRRS